MTSTVDSSKQLAQLATMLESTAPPSLLLLSQVHLQRVPDGHLPGVPRHCDLAGPLVLDLGAHGLPGEPQTPAKNSLAHADMCSPELRWQQCIGQAAICTATRLAAARLSLSAAAQQQGMGDSPAGFACAASSAAADAAMPARPSSPATSVLCFGCYNQSPLSAATPGCCVAAACVCSLRRSRATPALRASCGLPGCCSGRTSLCRPGWATSACTQCSTAWRAARRAAPGRWAARGAATQYACVESDAGCVPVCALLLARMHCPMVCESAVELAASCTLLAGMPTAMGSCLCCDCLPAAAAYSCQE